MNYKNVKRSLLSLALTTAMLVPQTAMAAEMEVVGAESATQAVDVSMEVKSAYSVSLPAIIELQYDAEKEVGDGTMEGYWYDLKYGVAGFIASNEKVYCRPLFPSNVTGEASGKVMSLVDPGVAVIYSEDFSGVADVSDFATCEMYPEGLSLENDVTHGNYFSFKNSGNIDQTAVVTMGNADTTNSNSYILEFDAAFDNTSGYGQMFRILTSDYDLFTMQFAGSSITCNLGISPCPIQLENNEWYHFKLEVTKDTHDLALTVDSESGNVTTCESKFSGNSGDINYMMLNLGKENSVYMDNINITGAATHGSCKINWSATEVGECVYDHATSTVSNCEYAYCCESGHPIGILADTLEVADKYTGQITFEFGLETN